MDIITYVLSKKYTNIEIAKVVAALSGGMKYKGSVATVADLPTASEDNKGHVYTVLANNHEYLSDGTQWLDLDAELDLKATKEELQAEVTARTNADTTITNNLNTEISDRQTADTTLQTNITNEATARSGADTTLQNNIDAEATARTNADTALQNSKQEKLVAGPNVTIAADGKTISAQGYTVTLDV